MYRYINSSKIVIFMQSTYIWNILDAFYKHIPPCICYENSETLANLPLYWRYYFQGLWGLWFSPNYIHFCLWWGFWHSVWSPQRDLSMCVSWRVTGPESGACVSSPQEGHPSHYLQTPHCRGSPTCFLAKHSASSRQGLSNCCYKADSSEDLS